MFNDHYTGKRVLVTGHTGFKGSWLSLWLHQLGAGVHGIALDPETSPNLFETIHDGVLASDTRTDIRDSSTLDAAVAEVNPDFVFHLAAQPLVRRSYVEPVQTVQTNVLGTIHLLEAVRKLDRPVPVLVVTTDKCYENLNWDHGYRETDPLGGHDVYSMSKAACELAVAAWRRSFFETNDRLGNVATARAGNVIGGGDFAFDRIVPDCIRSLQAGEPIRVRNPIATRPWQHVLDCLSGYLWLGARLAQSPKNSPLASAFNFGPPLNCNRTVKDLVTEVLKHWAGTWEDASDPTAVHEAGRLHLSIDKAAARLDWLPTWDFAEAVRHTVKWYQQEGDLQSFSRGQIEQFTMDAHAGGCVWATDPGK